MSVAVSVQPPTMRYVSMAETVRVVATSAQHYFLPSDLSDLMLWVRADTITGKANGETVSYWSDESGQGNHVQSITPYYPMVYQTNSINGLPTLRNSLPYGAISTLSIIGKRPKIFVVCRQHSIHDATGGDGSGPMLGHYTAGGSSDVYLPYTVYTSNQYWLGYGNQINQYFRASGLPCLNDDAALEQAIIIRLYYGIGQAANTSKFSVNGVTTSGTINSSDWATPLGQISFWCIDGNGYGTRYPSYMDIAEIIVYGSINATDSAPANQDLSAENIAKIYSYLSNKYAITLA